MIGGTCDPQFGAVREAFVANFAERGEIGAAVCVSVGGRRVVDLWGGYADVAGTRPWAAQTLVNVYSIGKAIGALCLLRLVDAGRVDLDAPVATYWSAFATAGKGEVTVRQLLSHRAGLPALRAPLPTEVIYDWDAMTSALAAETPWWPPGTAHGYHVNTFGFLVGEIVRRVDGRTLGTALRDDVAGPLGADFHLGLPREEHRRVAEFDWPPALVDPSLSLRAHPADMIANAYFNPPGLSGAGTVNTPAWRSAEIPSANSHATARGVTRVYEALTAGGSIDGVRVIGAAALAEATAEAAAGDDLVLGRPSRFGLGFQLTQPERPLGPNAGAFGHFGAGGSLGFCDPDAGIAFGYVMNRMGPRWQNPLNRALVDAVYASLGSQR